MCYYKSQVTPPGALILFLYFNMYHFTMYSRTHLGTLCPESAPVVKGLGFLNKLLLLPIYIILDCSVGQYYVKRHNSVQKPSSNYTSFHHCILPWECPSLISDPTWSARTIWTVQMPDMHSWIPSYNKTRINTKISPNVSCITLSAIPKLKPSFSS